MNKGILAIIVLITIAIALADGAVYLQKKINWQTYRDDNGNYSFKYPPEWQLVTVTSADGNIERPYSFKTSKGEVTFMVDNWRYTGTLGDFFNNFVVGFKNSESYWVRGVVSNEQIVIGGKPAKKAYVDIGDCREVNIHIKNNDRLYAFVFDESCSSGAVDSEVSKNFDQILSTFKFIK